MSRSKVCIIAEAGVNHNGSVDTAVELIDVAKSVGADVVKFQTFVTSEIVRTDAGKAAYQRSTTDPDEPQSEMLSRLELSEDAHRALRLHADSCGIEFLSTPFDRPSLRFLVSDLGLGRVKISSTDLTNAPLLLDAAVSGVSVILSTGMANLDEIKQALKFLAFGYLRGHHPNSHSDLDEMSSSEDVGDALRSKVTILHCTTAYPTRREEANLLAIPALAETFKIPVGFSDHTLGVSAATAAVALGAVVIEKHLTLDRTLVGPDHAASSDPAEFADLVTSIREMEAMLGSGIKVPSPTELDNLTYMRKGLYAARDLEVGEMLGEGDIKVLRPNTSIGPERIYELIGRPCPRAMLEGEPFQLNMWLNQ